jgi:hypothetical protein
MHRLGHRGRSLFRTHEPPFRTAHLAIGRIIEHEGGFYRVTRWVELPLVHLERGGSVGEWEIWGRKVSARRLRREVLGAAEAILAEEPQTGPDDIGSRE